MKFRWPPGAVAKVDRGARRTVKFAAQMMTGRPATAAPLFILGCQRSGTNMLLGTLDASRETWTYNEHHGRAFEQVRLRDRERIEALVAGARCQWVVFKSICDSQHADVLLAEYPGSKVLWIIRGYQAVATSAVRRWGRGQLSLIRRLATDETWDHWLAERIPPERRDQVRDLYGRGLSINSAAALKWYLRNELFFDRKLDRVPDRALLVSYEDLVADPAGQFAEVFDFVGMRFDPAFVRQVMDKGGPGELPDLDGRDRELCDDLSARLAGALRDQRMRSAAR